MASTTRLGTERKSKSTIVGGNLGLKEYLAGQVPSEWVLYQHLFLSPNSTSLSSEPVAFENEYPLAHYYPEIVNSATDLKTYQEQKNKMRARLERPDFFPPDHDNWMLNYVGETRTNGGYFQLILPDGTVRRVTNTPEQVCQIIGSNNIFDYPRSNENIVCGSSTYNQSLFPRNLLPQPLRIRRHNARDAETKQEAKNPTLSENHCSRLTNEGKECIAGFPQSFRFPNSKSSEELDAYTDCTQECLHEQCPAWISDFILKIPASAIKTEKDKGGFLFAEDYVFTNYQIRFSLEDLLEQRRELTLRIDHFPPIDWQVKEQFKPYSLSGDPNLMLKSSYQANSKEAVNIICRFLNSSNHFSTKLKIKINMDSLPPQRVAPRKIEGYEFFGPASEVRTHLKNWYWVFVGKNPPNLEIFWDLNLEPYRKLY